MNPILKQKIIDVCNTDDNPELLIEAAQWWIMTHQLDHFEKAIKVKQIVKDMHLV